MSEKAFIDDLSNRIRPLLNTLEELKGAGLERYLSLPRIAVVGLQSSGKTSVIESILGKSFLPKSAELATRLPIVLILKRVITLDEDEYLYKIGESRNSLETVLYKDLGENIQTLTDKLAGTSFEITDIPIYVEISAKNIPELELVDLPGIAKVARANSAQHEDIEDLTTGIVNAFINDPSTIILAISSANQDIQGSDALKLARKADPEQIRTIGVLTKLDLMDRGVDARDVLEGKIINLALGFVAVVNRSQEDINTDVSVKQAIEKEERFFKEHPVYKNMPKQHFGCARLSAKLMQVLMERISSQLPSIRELIKDRLNKVATELDNLGNGVPEDSVEKEEFFDQLLLKVCKHIQEKLQTSARQFVKSLRDCSYDIERVEYDKKELEEKFLEQNDSLLPTFASIETFASVTRQKLRSLQEPASKLLEDLQNYIKETYSKVLETDLAAYRFLYNEMDITLQKIIKEMERKTKEILSMFFEISEFVYTMHSEFVSLLEEPENTTSKRISGINESYKFSNPLLPIENSVDDIVTKFQSYMKIQKRIYVDVIPKIIATRIWRDLFEELNSRTKINKQFKKADIDQLLQENNDIMEKRQKAKEERTVLENSLKIINCKF